MARGMNPIGDGLGSTGARETRPPGIGSVAKLWDDARLDGLAQETWGSAANSVPKGLDAVGGALRPSGHVAGVGFERECPVEPHPEPAALLSRESLATAWQRSSA